MTIELKYTDVATPVTITDAISYTTKTATKTEVVSIKQTALEYVKVIN